MNYVLCSVFKSMALDEIYRMVSDEYDLTKEDLHDVNETLMQVCNPGITFSELESLRDNLNITPAQERLTEREAVLSEKLQLLHELKEVIYNMNIKGFTSSPVFYHDDDAPF